MILLDNTSYIVQVQTSTSQALHVHASWVDLNSSTSATTPGKQDTPPIASATTTTIVPSPGSNVARNVKHLSLFNAGSSANTVTVSVYNGTTAYVLNSVSLPAGWALQYNDLSGWSLVNPNGGTDLQVCTASAFTMPSVGSTVSGVLFSSATPLWVGALLQIVDGAGNQGAFSVTAVTGSQATLQTLGAIGNSPASTSIGSGASVTPLAPDVMEKSLELFGDGSDGVLTPAASGTLTLTRDMYYSAIGPWPSGSTYVITTAGYRIFCSGTLNLQNAPTGAISPQLGATANGVNGTTAGGAGAAGTAVATGTLGGATAGSAGGAGSVGAGGSSSATTGTNNGGVGGAGGTGGTGVGGTVAGGTAAAAPTNTLLPVHRIQVDFEYASALITAGSGGTGGGAGGGITGHDGGGGGGGGAGGGWLVVQAAEVYRDSTTTVAALRSNGGGGGNGGTATTATVGGGGGGAGGGGGPVWLLFGMLSGTTVAALLRSVGTAGGSGGNGDTTGDGGNGGDSGASGPIIVVNLTAGTCTFTTTAGASRNTGNAGSGTTGGTGGTNVLNSVAV